MKFSTQLLLFISTLFTVILGACGNSSPGDAEGNSAAASTPIRIFAAAGTRPAANEICDLFEKQTGIKVERNYASSGTLARQIDSGAQTDVFISANEQWMTFLREKQLLKNDSIQTIAGNSLVIIAPKASPKTSIQFTPEFNIADLAEHIAVGDPAYVPVGKYTDAVFQNLKWSAKLKGKMILGKDVSSVLQYVELGECELGVVYRSEALASSKVQIVAEIPQSLHKPIVFFVAEMKHAESPEAAHQLKEMIVNEGTGIFLKHGFSPPGGS